MSASFDPSSVPLRILVTGTRGKSSLVRLLHAGLLACGLESRARITGVLPRELSLSGCRTIRRAAPAHVREMRWWLAQVPRGTDAVVMENSAVAPELQEAAGAWLRPTLVVWTTLRSDHAEAWGPGIEGAARTLAKGVPCGVPVAGGPETAHPGLTSLLRERGCPLHILSGPETPASHREANLALALHALSLCGIPAERLSAARLEMAALSPDIADFRVLGEGEDLLAAAFSANEAESTGRLFGETGWDPSETTLLYHHRPDRPERLRGFLPWIASRPWRRTVFTRTGGPFFTLPFAPFAHLGWEDGITDAPSFEVWRRGRGRVFACGNVAGWPLEFLARCEDVKLS